MDWFSIVLIFLFIVLPIIQQFAGKARRGTEPEEKDAPGFDLDVTDAPVALGNPAKRDGDPEGWSAGWTPWPSESSPVEPEPAPTPEPRFPSPARREMSFERATPEVFSRWEMPAARPRPAVGAQAHPREKVEIVPYTRPIRNRPIVEVVPLVADVAIGDLRRRPLSDPAELRRAIVLAEIVGPPVSMRPPWDI